MATSAGSIQEISINGRRFVCEAEESADISYGGKSNEAKMNGDGSYRTVSKRVPWKVSGLNLNIDNSKGDMEFLQDICDNGTDCVIRLALCDVTLQGAGTISGGLEFKTMDGTVEVELVGGGKLEQQ